MGKQLSFDPMYIRLFSFILPILSPLKIIALIPLSPCINYFPTEDQVADILTKPLGNVKFSFFKEHFMYTQKSEEAETSNLNKNLEKVLKEENKKLAEKRLETKKEF